MSVMKLAAIQIEVANVVQAKKHAEGVEGCL
jgi:hypothetical protein